MQLESLNCPNCGGPLRVEPQQTLSLCLYCNTSIRITRADPAQNPAPPALSLQSVANANVVEVVTKVKQLLLDGRRAEAITLYRERADVSAQEAEGAVNGLYNTLAFGILGGQPLSPLGWLYLGLAVVIGILGVLWGLRLITAGSTLSGVAVIALAVGFAALNLAVFGRGIPASILVLFGQPAEATVLKVSRIGEMKGWSQGYLARLWLEMRPGIGAAYRVEINGAISPASFAKLHPGAVIAVRCSAGDPKRVIPEMPLRVVTG
jgi:xanthosine utilization system XapX-like protein